MSRLPERIQPMLKCGQNRSIRSLMIATGPVDVGLEVGMIALGIVFIAFRRAVVRFWVKGQNMVAESFGEKATRWGAREVRQGERLFPAIGALFIVVGVVIVAAAR